MGLLMGSFLISCFFGILFLFTYKELLTPASQPATRLVEYHLLRKQILMETDLLNQAYTTCDSTSPTGTTSMWLDRGRSCTGLI